MSPASLDGVHAKLTRAYMRLEELDRLVEDFRNPKDPYRLVKQEHYDGTDTTTISYRFRIERPIPAVEWSLVIGEFLYDVRSALDHLAWQLAALHCAPYDPPKGTRFPIFCSKRGFFEQMRSRCGRGRRWAYSSGAYQFRAMSAGAQARILELQPYVRRKNPERDPLWVLHQLCNQDKHETFPLMLSSIRVKKTVLPDNEAEIRVPFKRHGPLHDGAEVLRLVGKHPGPNTKMKVNAEFCISEAFDKTGPAAGNRIGPQLKDIYNDIIVEVLPRFREFFEE